MIGRAGVGVDNVDVRRRHEARDRRRQRAAVERRHRRRAHDGAAAGARAQHPAGASALHRRQIGPLQVLRRRAVREDAGILGFGRIGQLVAERARGFDMRVLTFDPFVSAERYRELASRSRRRRLRCTRRPTSSRCTCRRRPRPKAGSDADAFAKMRDGVRVLNVARGGLIVDAALRRLDSGKVAAPRSTCSLRADDRLPAVRLAQRRRHAAPRRVDRRGDRSRRLPVAPSRSSPR